MSLYHKLGENVCMALCVYEGQKRERERDLVNVGF